MASNSPIGRFDNEIPAYAGGDVAAFRRDDHPRLASSLHETLRRLRADMIESIAKNRAKDFPEYKYLCGQIDGLDIAIHTAKEVQNKLES